VEKTAAPDLGGGRFFHLDSLSDFFSIHLNAVVERDVSHTNDVGPRDIGMSLLKRRRDVSRSFADDVEYRYPDALLSKPSEPAQAMEDITERIYAIGLSAMA
jgi:hypothetical protein